MVIKMQQLSKNQKQIISYIKLILLAFIISLFIRHVLIVNANIPSGSMESTIMTHDKLIAIRFAYLFETPKRGDIVIFPFPDNEKQKFIKRIIGLPGEKVEGKDGTVYVNDTPLRETYVKDKLDNDFGPFYVPKDSYFMMGDNRIDSYDSRYWNHPFVKKEKILGKAIFEYSPHFKNLD